MSKKEMNKIRIALFARLRYLVIRDSDDKVMQHFSIYSEAIEKCYTLEKTEPNINNRTHWKADYYVMDVKLINLGSASYYKFMSYVECSLNNYNANNDYKYTDNEIYDIHEYIIDYYTKHHFEMVGA